jgi:predicted  nucleic acid-binding Zn-ribbon protein
MEINKEISMATNNGTRDHKLEIELLKRDVTSIREFNQKLDDTVDKIEEAARDIKTNLTQHEYKILRQEHINKDMEEQLEKHIKESEERARELNTKIKCVDDKIEKVNSIILYDKFINNILDCQSWSIRIFPPLLFTS